MPGDIASYLAVIVLPWAFKLVTGPLMDRYEFLPMGSRRPWVLGAQLGLSLSLLALMLIEDPVEQIGLLMLVGVLINSFAATQDVAVDGMSIDLTPVNEQGRLNAFMSFGKAVGWGVTAAVSGVLLVTFGMKVTAMVAAGVAGVVFLASVFVLEHRGERRLPWSDGTAVSKHRGSKNFKAVFADVNQVLGLLLIGMMLVLSLHRHRHDSGRGRKRKGVSRYTITTGGSEAGVFFSGAMRCPKCHGIWFDAGEVEVLRNKEAAAVIDTGQLSEGKHYNQIDHYNCPRCGGTMERMVDPRQRHIWFETCSDCKGSFFDAGEFLDLSQLTISDFFKRIITPARN